MKQGWESVYLQVKCLSSNSGTLQLKNKKYTQRHLTGLYFNLTWTRLGIHSRCLFDVAIGSERMFTVYAFISGRGNTEFLVKKSVFLQWEIIFLQTTIKFSLPGFSAHLMHPKVEHTQRIEGLSPTHGHLYACAIAAPDAKPGCFVRKSDANLALVNWQGMDSRDNHKKQVRLGTQSCHKCIWAPSVTELLLESLLGKLRPRAAKVLRHLPASSEPMGNTLVPWQTLLHLSCCQMQQMSRCLRCLDVPYVPCLAPFQVTQRHLYAKAILQKPPYRNL